MVLLRLAEAIVGLEAVVRRITGLALLFFFSSSFSLTKQAVGFTVRIFMMIKILLLLLQPKAFATGCSMNVPMLCHEHAECSNATRCPLQGEPRFGRGGCVCGVQNALQQLICSMT